MPETNLEIEWPDGTRQKCYSPSLVVKKHFKLGKEYELANFVEKSRTAFHLASDRVKATYGFDCSRALQQIKQIEAKALEYGDLSDPKVRVIDFLDL